ncbi:hypothetical protein WN48_02160 [Eufriesea mexicana]|uniref:Homeobox domain-containing protein n=1 Tax=Eufriesea mexicana TaxID=516756 RepID=A0A310SGL8_9HYME|nr:hypothetical protein WN48_02160 [Eufriesea mexicana]
MKSASKPKDFSINSILADVSFQNDQYKKASVSSVSAMCQNDIQKEKYERKSATAFKINVEDKVGLNTKNNVMSVKKETNFDITSNKMYLINNVCNNDESETKNYGVSPQRRSEVEAEGKYDHHEQCTYLLNTEENIVNHFHPVLDTIENCTSDINVTRLIIVEGKNAKNNRNLSVLVKQREFNFDETNELKLMSRTEKEYVINSKYLKPKKEFGVSYEEISERYCNIKVNKHEKKIRNFENQKKMYNKIQDKQSKEDKEKDFGNSRVKWLNNNYGNLLETENGGSKIENLESMENIVELEWLQCTRYKPPKIPRKSAVGKNKRKPSLHPRIPFSTFQLDFLEQQFRSSAYLSKQDVLKISNVLNLSANRVCTFSVL